MTLTRGRVGQHHNGKSGGFYPAMLDVAQDHLLFHLHQQGMFDLGLIFKGGTSLRKMRAGAAGRFSTDVDFCVTEQDLRPVVLGAVDNLDIEPFHFDIANRDDDAGRADLVVTGPFGPNPRDTGPTRILIASKIEMSPRQPWLAPETLPFLDLPVHHSYDIGPLPELPVVRIEEAIAEKLARYARVGLARDLYDLVWFGNQGVIDEPLVRTLWILKTYQDVVLDRRWRRAFTPADILTPRSASDIDEESIGFLTSPVTIAKWEEQFRQRYAFLADLTDDEAEWAKCDAGRQYELSVVIADFR